MTRKWLEEIRKRYGKQKLETGSRFPFSNFLTNFHFPLTNFLCQIMTKYKPQLKRFTRAIAWLLILTIIANILNAFVAPKTARAVTQMFLFWAGTCSSPPSGWTDETAAGKAFAKGAYGGIFPRGNNTYAANNGSMGTETHDHTVGGSQTATSGTTRNGTSGSGYSATAHVHPITGSTNLVSSLPAYKDLCVISYPSIPTTIPSGAIAIFDTGTVPTNWQDCSTTTCSGLSATFGTNYIRANTTAGGTGGNNTHAGAGHTISGITLTAAPQVVTTTTGSSTRASVSSHTHTVANQTSDTPNTEPPYITVELYQATADTTIPPHMIAMFDGTTFTQWGTYDWEIVSNSGGDFYQRFPKVTGTYGTKSGATEHHHADKTGLTSSTYVAVNGANGSGGIQGHSHTVTVTEADGTDTNVPPYTNVIYAKASYFFDSMATDKVPPLKYGQGENVSVTATLTNHSNTALSAQFLYICLFRDTATHNHWPDVGETYMTPDCAGTATFTTGCGSEYTWRDENFNLAADTTVPYNHSCANTNFPDDDEYLAWGRWDISTLSGYVVTNYTHFLSVPTLTEILFLALVGCMVFLGVRTGVIKFRKNGNIGPKDIIDPSKPPINPIDNINTHSHQNHPPDGGLPRGSIDGVSHIERKK